MHVLVLFRIIRCFSFQLFQWDESFLEWSVSDANKRKQEQKDLFQFSVLRRLEN